MPVFERTPRPEKVEAVDEIKEILASATLILTDFQGLNVKSISGLRGRLREAGCGYRVVKNTLLNIAAEDAAIKPLTETLKGQTAIVYTEGDPVAAAKILQQFIKETKAPLKVKAGVVDGNLFNDKQMEALATMPSKQELYGMVVGGLQSPITGLVGTLQQLISQLVFTLQGVADKKAAA